jgi:phytoene desaturase
MKIESTGSSGGALPPAAGAEGRRAVVIGSGFGGLAAAVRLSALGWQVQVFDRLGTPGGRARVHEIDGFRFDAGPTIITVPQLFEDLWKLCGRRLADDVQLVSLDPFYRVRFDDGSWFDYSGDEQRMRAEVTRICATDLPGYEAFVREADLCFREGFEALGSTAFRHIGDLIAAVPNMVRMRGWRTIWQMACKHFKSPKLRVAFSFHPLLIGGNPRAVTCTYSLINSLERQFGVHWAMGGTGSLVRGLVNLLASRGVPVRLNAEVQRIVVEDGQAKGVLLASGERIDADIVVSNGDTAWTYKYLVEPQHRRRWSDRRLDRMHYSMGLFVWYFGTKRRFDTLPHHQIVLGPRYQGLLDDIFKRHHLAEDFSLYLHRPTATDPQMAPPGCDTFYALSPVPHLDSGTDWATAAEGYRARIQRRLEQTVMPGLGESIVVSHMTTPQQFQDELLSYKGAGFGMEPRLLQSAWFRPHNRSEDVRGLYIVGASGHPGAGVPGVLMSALALESVLPPLGPETAARPQPAAAAPMPALGAASPGVRP